MQHDSAANFQLSILNFQLFCSIFAANYEKIPCNIYIAINRLAVYASTTEHEPGRPIYWTGR